jgi:uncharacterized protein (TIGR03437 family)
MLPRGFTFVLIGASRILASGVQSLPPLSNGAVAEAVRVDSSGNLYVAGSNGSGHAFVAKLTPGAAQTVWITDFAGSKTEAATALALGPGGAVYAAGTTQSTDFPTTPGALQPSGPAGSAFAVKLDSNGKVTYSTYLPASNCHAITADAEGHLLLTGILEAGQTFSATPGAVMGAPLPSGVPYASSYILEIDPTGSTIDMAIIGFGGYQIAVDAQGYIYAAGAFLGPLAPTTPGAFQSTVAVNVCAASPIMFPAPCLYQHLAKIDPTGTRLVYATYLDGSWGASPSGLAVDSAGNVMVAGTTSSPDYPTTPGAYQPEYFANPAVQTLPPFLVEAPPTAGYLTKLNATGTALVWSSYFAGSGGKIPDSVTTGDAIAGMAVDASGNVLIAGFASSADFPGLWNTPVASRPPVPANGVSIGFVGRLSPDGAAISPVQLVDALLFSEAEPPNFLTVAADGSAVLAGPALLDVSLAAPGRVQTICDPADGAKVVAVAPGQLLTLYGDNLAPAGPGTPSGLPTAFNGVTVTFNGIAAPILYAAAGQINLEVPFEIAGQPQATMQISSQSVTPEVSESYYLAIVPRQPAAFVSAANFSGPFFDIADCGGQAVAGIQALAVNPDGSINTCTNPAAPGSMVTLFLDGLGVTAPPEITGAISASAVAISPSAALVPSGSGLPAALVTQTVAGSISAVAAVQVPAPAASSALHLELVDSEGAAYLVRGPGIIVWAAGQ